MKIIVSHEGKQHVNHLLVAIYQRGYLQKFYAGFASNNFPYIQKFLPFFESHFQKRFFHLIPSKKIESFFFSSAFQRLKFGYYFNVTYLSRFFDLWVKSKITKNQDFDCLIGYENANLYSFKKAKALGKITVLDLAQIHQTELLEITKKHFPLSVIEDKELLVNKNKDEALAYSDYVLTLSSFATNSLIKHGFSEKKIFEVNLGVDSAVFAPIYPKKNDGIFKILFVGALSQRKGIRDLLSAFSSLNLKNSTLTLVGPMVDTNDLLRKYQQENILCFGYLHHEELKKYYQQADVFVFPSYLDSWGQVVLEAMASGTPVIVSDNTGARDAVVKGGGFIIPTGDIESLKEKILFFYNNRDAVKIYGKKARDIAKQYSWENYYRRILEIMDIIAEKENINL